MTTKVSIAQGYEADAPPKAWVEAYAYGRPGEYTFYPVMRGAAIRIDKPDHLEIMKGLIGDDFKVEYRHNIPEDERLLIVSKKHLPWERRPWLPGIGELLAIREEEKPPVYESTMIIDAIQRGWTFN